MMGKSKIMAAVVALGVLGAAGSASADSGRVREVRMLDRCDQASFDAVVGPGTCAPIFGDDGVTFAEFAAELNPTDFGHDKWAFSQREIGVRPGERIHIVNRGGEFHTFTRVARFGGGCVPELNAPLGLSSVPECANPAVFATGGPAGAEFDVIAPATEGTAKYMCVIHPWMRTKARVER
jgi:plastocyanin